MPTIAPYPQPYLRANLSSTPLGPQTRPFEPAPWKPPTQPSFKAVPEAFKRLAPAAGVAAGGSAAAAGGGGYAAGVAAAATPAALLPLALLSAAAAALALQVKLSELAQLRKNEAEQKRLKDLLDEKFRRSPKPKTPSPYSPNNYSPPPPPAVNPNATGHWLFTVLGVGWPRADVLRVAGQANDAPTHNIESQPGRYGIQSARTGTFLWAWVSSMPYQSLDQKFEPDEEPASPTDPGGDRAPKPLNDPAKNAPSPAPRANPPTVPNPAPRATPNAPTAPTAPDQAPKPSPFTMGGSPGPLPFVPPLPMPVPPRGNPPTSPTIDSVGKNALQPNAQDLNLKKEAPPTPFNPPDQKNPTCLYDSRGIKPAVEAGNSKLDAISGVLNAVQTVQLVGIDNKLGPQVSGGLSGAVGRVSNLVRKSWDFLQVDRVLSVLTYVTTLHNAMMLSNALSQTLFSAVGNVLAAIGIGKLEEDGSTSPMDIGAEVAKWTEGFFKGIFGVETVDGIKANWKKYNRIYQAAANIVWSVQSIGQSVLAALEVVGSHVAKIGNALKKWGEVGENAFTWMNPQPNFQNRFFTALQNTEEVVSQVDQVASEVLSAQQTITHIGQQKSDLKKAISETDPAVPGPGTSEALKIKDSADTAKSNSQSSAIAPDTLIKPGG